MKSSEASPLAMRSIAPVSIARSSGWVSDMNVRAISSSAVWPVSRQSAGLTCTKRPRSAGSIETSANPIGACWKATRKRICACSSSAPARSASARAACASRYRRAFSSAAAARSLSSPSSSSSSATSAWSKPTLTTPIARPRTTRGRTANDTIPPSRASARAVSEIASSPSPGVIDGGGKVCLHRVEHPLHHGGRAAGRPVLLVPDRALDRGIVVDHGESLELAVRTQHVDGAPAARAAAPRRGRAPVRSLPRRARRPGEVLPRSAVPTSSPRASASDPSPPQAPHRAITHYA